MQWRKDAFGTELRYANPFECDDKCCFKCGFEELTETGDWTYPATVPAYRNQLVGENLLSKQRLRARTPSLVAMKR